MEIIAPSRVTPGRSLDESAAQRINKQNGVGNYLHGRWINSIFCHYNQENRKWIFYTQPSLSYLSVLLNRRCYARTLRSCSQEILTVPRSRTVTYDDRAFSIAGPKLWNELPLSLRKVKSVDVFKSQLKTYLFKQAYNCWPLFILIARFCK